MIKLMGKIVVILLVLHSLVVLGLLGYALASGRLNGQAYQQYLATWRGEKLVTPPAEVTQEKETEAPQDAAAKIGANQLKQEIYSRELQMYAQQLRDKDIAIAAAQQKLAKDLKELKQKQKQFNDLVAQHNAKVKAEGFQKALKDYSNMKAKYVKDDFMTMQDEDAVRYLSAMKTDVATAVLEQFRTPEELAKRQRLMILLEKQGLINLQEQGQQVSQNQ